MKVAREFAPITIRLDSEQDVIRFTQLVRYADTFLADVISKGQLAPDDLRVQCKELSYDLLKFLGRLDL